MVNHKLRLLTLRRPMPILPLVMPLLMYLFTALHNGETLPHLLEIGLPPLSPFGWCFRSLIIVRGGWGAPWENDAFPYFVGLLLGRLM